MSAEKHEPAGIDLIASSENFGVIRDPDDGSLALVFEINAITVAMEVEEIVELAGVLQQAVEKLKKPAKKPAPAKPKAQAPKGKA